jgi:ferrochelatase
MRLENFLALTHATLINEPFVNNFENITFEATKVKRGDLFFAFSEDDIELAVLNGAYGVVFDKPTQISDAEIAWIKVDDLNDALKRLLRFKMIEKEIVAYECDEIILKLSLQIITQTNFIILGRDIKSIFKSLWNIDDKAIALFCPTPENKNIFAATKQLPENVCEPIEIVEQTLFETSFIYDDVFYERQLISPFFMPYLEKLLHMYKSLKINFRLRKFIPIEHFEAVFVNKNLEQKEFGTTDKVLIFEKNIDLVNSEISFLQKNANWAKIIYIVPHNSKYNENIFTYSNEEEIINILKSTFFHFALIVGVDKSILSRPLSIQTQLTLDF